MKNYVINRNKDAGGRNEVHSTDCNRKPYPQNCVAIGWHDSEIGAVAYAKSIGWKSADGCYYCCPKAHHG